MTTAGRIRGITIEIGGDTTKLQEALKQVNKDLKQTGSALGDVNKLLKDPNNAGNTELLAQKQRLLADAVEATDQKLKQEKEALAQLKEGPQTEKTIEQQQRLTREVADTESALKRLTKQYEEFGSVGAQQLAAVGGKMQEVGGKITDAGKALAPVSGAAAGALAASAKAAIDWETAFTGVKKTNEELVDENGKVIISYDDLADSIKKMATETASSKAEIAAVMEAAGQLGVGTQYLEEFTRTMIMLGDSTNLSADEAATALAKFANVTGMSLDDVDKLGAALVDLGNNYATDEQSILEMATRLAGAGAQIGLSEGEILGFATALSSVGIEAEMGGSAFSKAMIKMQVAAETGFSDVNALMGQFGDIIGRDFDSFREFELFWKNLSGKDQKEFASSLQMTTAEITKLVNSRAELEGFADVAGMTAEQFVELYGKSAPDALSAFIQGLADTEGRGESTIQMLQDMGFTEVRLRDTLTRAANASELFSNALATGNSAFQENTALAEEANKRYETTEAQVSQTKETITNLAVEIGEQLLPIVKDLLEDIKGAVEWFSNLDEGTKENIVRIGLFVAAISPLLIAIGSIITGVGTLLTMAPMIAGAMAAISGPVGIVIGIIAALVGGILVLYNTNEDFKALVDSVWPAIKERIGGVIDAIWQGIKDFCGGIVENLNGLWDVVSGIVKLVVSLLRGDWDGAWESAKQIVKGAVNAIIGAVRAIAAPVDAAIGAIKSLLGWQSKAEKSTGGGGGGRYSGGGSVTRFASGYQNAMILQSPTIFGRGRSGSYLMGGDGAGAEAVVGTDLLGRIVRENSGFGGDIVIPVSIGGTQLERVVVRANQINTFRRG